MALGVPKSESMGCLTVKMWAVLVASFQILIGSVVFVVGVLGLYATPDLMETHSDQQDMFHPDTVVDIHHKRKSLTERAAHDQLFVFLVTFNTFLLVLSIGTFLKGIILHVGIKNEKEKILIIWRILMILNILAGLIGFIVVSFMQYPKFKPITVTLICNGMWGLFFIWVVRKFQSELHDVQQRAVLLRRPKK